ncbi:arylesterase [Gilvimarinus agarilyticus]|uniref:arylesterase n=1 Tax=Gilvimarinus sp. 2_MG-2023 TaxID=3062666 RepID=UPI001C08ADB4|nr:arylesterase [Gilvimarinus sp. 2_MG-2023]MBU2886001.1 arylesterase [Gilvimarinus agarilyticus]MDO6570747.1 arylesterase [Gilvimarinus sp. 2_MG-2023]
MTGGLKRLILVNSYLICLFLASFAQADNKTLLVVGDSLSAGYGIDIKQGWVHQLQLKLDREQLAYTVVNASVSGETTTGGKARLPKLLETHQPDIVLLELGANDGLRGQPIKIPHNNLANMITAVQNADAQVLLIGIQIPPNYGARYTEAFAGIFARLAQTYDTALVPFLLEGVALNPQLMLKDGIHPTAEAQPILLDTVWPYLKPLL